MKKRVLSIFVTTAMVFSLFSTDIQVKAAEKTNISIENSKNNSNKICLDHGSFGATDLTKEEEKRIKKRNQFITSIGRTAVNTVTRDVTRNITRNVTKSFTRNIMGIFGK